MKKLFEEDALTSEERLKTVINLQVPDRPPSCPFIYYFAARYAGVTAREITSDPSIYRAAMDLCFEELGPWDIYYPVNPRYPQVYSFIMPMRARWPGVDLDDDSPCQLIEGELMKEEDYRWIIEEGSRHRHLAYLVYFVEMIARAWDISSGRKAYAYVLPRLAMHLAGWRREFASFSRRGVTTLYGFLPEAAFDSFSLARGLTAFVKDCMRHPDEVAAAADALTDSYFFVTRLITALLGVPRAEIFVHRSSNDFISPEMFRELSFPSLKRLADRLVAAGISPVLHLDGDWDENLPILRGLPAGNCVAQFDGRTDIFLAKRVIGDRVCIMGDVPATMLSLGSASEVDEYCHRLIEEVGLGGGFIMAAGCEIPPDARPANVRAMLQSVVKYGYVPVADTVAVRSRLRARVRPVAFPTSP
ncbi:MAG TPA: uroporphyrinogen decarboxylase family protein [Candidatus Anoxymicrobiaceae bacterium]